MNFKSFLFFSIILSLNILFFSCSNNEGSSDQIEENTEIVPDYSAGKAIYSKNCQTCHQGNGEGIPGAFPSLTEKNTDINSVVNGVEGSVMIAFKDILSDQQITEVINFINHNWGNKFDEIHPEDISEIK